VATRKRLVCGWEFAPRRAPILPVEHARNQVLAVDRRLNEDPEVERHPAAKLSLPPALPEASLLAAMIRKKKDADGLHSLKLGRLLKGEPVSQLHPAG